MNRKCFLVLLLILVASAAQAFPEMIRHHYVNCTACHVSQSGGGVLNSYGRSMTSEILSSWGNQDEARAFYSMDPETIGKWLNLGGNVRGVQTHYEDSNFKIARGFIMQASLEAALVFDKITAMMAIGQVETRINSTRLVAPKYFLSYQFSDEISLRAGRMIPVFGLQIPQHNFVTKDALLLGQGTERDLVEAFYNGDIWNFSFGYSVSPEQSRVRDQEKSVSARIAKVFDDSHKIGISVWNGEANRFTRSIFGIDAALGISEKFYILTEIDQMQTTVKATDLQTTSIHQMFKVGYEFKKGMHAQFVQQYYKPDASVVSIETQAAGLGATFYPRPHFEFEFLWLKQRTIGVIQDDYADIAYLLGHYYF